jgi:predicted metal-dependent hydrolase
MTALEYQVRVSRRARNPRLKLSVREGLVVVVPDGFDRSLIPGVVEGKRDWIRRSENRLREQRKFFVPQPAGVPPEVVPLRAIGQEWSVIYRQTAASTVSAAERRGQQLLLYGDVNNDAAVAGALERWLSRQTREHLTPWLVSLAEDRGLDVSGFAIRSQRTRWASCSRQGTISLNLRLMFLPPHLVRYALLHELAHLRELNHSKRYWALLSMFEPHFRELDQELRSAWRFVPEWMRPTSGP